jgi:uncharacterized protein (TIGR00661 family)
MAKILVSPLKWGLGHATRDAPIIKELLKHDHDVTIAASGRALELLKREFPQCTFIEFDDYPAPYSATRFFLAKFAVNIPRVVAAINDEKQRFKELMKNHDFDLIISDNRFGIHAEGVPSFIISHQLRFKLPDSMKPLEVVTQFFNTIFHKNFTKVLVPDDEHVLLSGKLCKSRFRATKKRTYFTGILSSVEKDDCEEDIDYLFSISGPEPQRTILQDIILRQIKTVPGKKVVLLGKPEEDVQEEMDENTIIKSHVSRKEMTKLMNRAKFIVTRSGYTTMMELAQLGKKKALFIPTPGQTEQEYLSRYYRRKGWFLSVSQYRLNLKRDIVRSRQFTGFPHVPDTQHNVEKLYREVIEPYLKKI